MDMSSQQKELLKYYKSKLQRANDETRQLQEVRSAQRKVTPFRRCA
jgi:hypothetical protein